MSFKDISGPMNWHSSFASLMLGVAVCFVVALIAIDILVRHSNRFGYVPYVIYRVLLGLFLIAWLNA